MYKYLIIVISLFFVGCIENENTSEIPYINYTKHESGFCYDDLGNETKFLTLTFKLKDGDGNFGLKNNDTIAPYINVYKHNFYYNFYYYNGHEFSPWESLSLNFYDIPYIEPQGQNKFLVADVTIQMQFSKLTIPYDTLLIDFFVYDRALNKSNIEYSDTIFFINHPEKFTTKQQAKN